MIVNIKAGIVSNIGGNGVDLQAEDIEIVLGSGNNKIIISQEDDDTLTIRSWHGVLVIYPQAANSARLAVQD